MSNATFRRWLLSAAVLLAAIAPAVVARIYVARHAESIAKDGTIYMHMAHMLEGPQAPAVIHSFAYPPGYPQAVRTMAALADAPWPYGWIASARAVSIFWSLLTLVSVYFIGLAAFDRRVAALTALLLGLSQPYILLSCGVTSDAQAIALASVAVALALGAASLVRRQNPWAMPVAALSALAAGAGYLTRPEELLAVVVAAVLLIKQRRLGTQGRIIQFASLAVLIAVAAACVWPYASAIGGLSRKKDLSDFVLGPAGGSLLAAADVYGHGLGDILAVLRLLFDRERASIGTPLYTACILWWASWLLPPLFRLRLPQGLRLSPRTSDGAVAMFLPLAVMLTLLGSLEFHRGPGYVSSRHLLMPMVLQSPTIAAGLVVFAQLLAVPAMKLGQMLRPRLLLIMTTVGMTGVLLSLAFVPLHEGKACLRQAGEKIIELYGPGRLILTDDSRIAFFAQAPAEQFVIDSPMDYQIRPHNLASRDAFLRLATRTHEGQPYAAVAFSEYIPTEKELAATTLDARTKLMVDLFATMNFRFICQSPHPRGREPLKAWVMDAPKGDANADVRPERN